MGSGYNHWGRGYTITTHIITLDWLNPMMDVRQAIKCSLETLSRKRLKLLKQTTNVFPIKTNHMELHSVLPSSVFTGCLDKQTHLMRCSLLQ